jgi:hypothetical protein
LTLRRSDLRLIPLPALPQMFAIEPFELLNPAHGRTPRSGPAPKTALDRKTGRALHRPACHIGCLKPRGEFLLSFYSRHSAMQSPPSSARIQNSATCAASGTIFAAHVSDSTLAAHPLSFSPMSATRELVVVGDVMGLKLFFHQPIEMFLKPVRWLA